MFSSIFNIFHSLDNQFMATSENPSSQLSILAPGFPISNEGNSNVSSDISVPASNSLFPESTLADLSTYISVNQPEVEVDDEVWTANTYQTDYGTSVYYTLQVPRSSGNVLIAKATLDFDSGLDVPGLKDHCWPVLTSERHIVDTIPSKFQLWMNPIYNFLEKSTEYFRPYENCLKRLEAVNDWFRVILVLLVIAVLVSIFFSVYFEFLILVVELPFFLVSFVLTILVKKNLANGVEVLKLCGKYEQSILPLNIKVSLGPYGAYWKFVLRS